MEPECVMGPGSVIRQQLPRPVRNSTRRKRLRGFKFGPQIYFYHYIVKLSFSSLRIVSKGLPGCPVKGQDKNLDILNIFPGKDGIT